jgi:hypothetical protein
MNPERRSEVAVERDQPPRRERAGKGSRKRNPSLSRKLRGGSTEPPGPRGSESPESTSQGSEFIGPP